MAVGRTWDAASTPAATLWSGAATAVGIYFDRGLPDAGGFLFMILLAMAIGLVLGLILGLALVFLWDALDTRVRSVETLRELEGSAEQAGTCHSGGSATARGVCPLAGAAGSHRT